MKNYEYLLPRGYVAVHKVDAKEKSTSLKFNGAAFVIMGIFIAILFLTKKFDDVVAKMLDYDKKTVLIGLLFFIVALLLYIVLHEIVHGIVYKAKTKQKLTFGLSLSCAYCGVPNIYCYRSTALSALVAPFLVFTAIFLPLVIIFYFKNAVLYYAFGILFASHVSGCVGDLYMTYLLLTKYKSKELLVRDTGPEQTLYLKQNKNRRS